jgi:ABC-type sulfate/molybdate transport systems ATPase subunit
MNDGTSSARTRRARFLNVPELADTQHPAGGSARHRVRIVGRSGAGRATTLRLLLGLIAPTAGTARVFGRSISDPGGYVARVGSAR